MAKTEIKIDPGYMPWLHDLTVYLYQFDLMLIVSPSLEGKVKALYEQGLTIEQAADKLRGIKYEVMQKL